MTRARGSSRSVVFKAPRATDRTSPRSAPLLERSERSSSSTPRRWWEPCPCANTSSHVDVMAAVDHKYLLDAGRGLGGCHLSPRVRDDFIPINAGWKAAATPTRELLRPEDGLVFDCVAVRQFDQLAGRGRERGGALGVRGFSARTPSTTRNAELSTLFSLSPADALWPPVDLPPANQSSIVSVPLGDRDPLEGQRPRSRNVESSAPRETATSA